VNNWWLLGKTPNKTDQLQPQHHLIKSKLLNPPQLLNQVKEVDRERDLVRMSITAVEVEATASATANVTTAVVVADRETILRMKVVANANTKGPLAPVHLESTKIEDQDQSRIIKNVIIDVSLHLHRIHQLHLKTHIIKSTVVSITAKDLTLKRKRRSVRNLADP
jgi:hypothetical protein